MVRRADNGPTKRQIRREARSQEIVDTAMRIVAEEGVNALTMPRLAQEAGAAVGALYRYFESKDALIGEMQLQAAQALADFLAGRIATPLPPDADPKVAALARVIRAFDTYLAYSVHEPVGFRLIDEVMSAPRPLLSEAWQRKVQQVVEPILERAGATLAVAAQVGALKPGDLPTRTVALWGAFHGLGHFRRHVWLQIEALRVVRLVRAQWEAVLVGWGADPALVADALALAASLPLAGPSEQVVDVDVDLR